MSSKKRNNCDKLTVIDVIILSIFFLTEVFTTLTMLLLWHKFGLATDLIDLIKILLR